MAIFISYRRGTTNDITGRIDDHLRAHFGRNAIFRDIDDIPLGVDFHEVLSQEVAKCRVLIAVIGPDWAKGRDPASPRDLASSRDFIHIEIAVALKAQIPIIPLLVGGATMPAEESLPPDLAGLARRQAVFVDSGSDFEPHMRKLIGGLERLLAIKGRPGLSAPISRSRAKLLISVVSGVAALALTAGVAAWLQRPHPVPPSTRDVPQVPKHAAVGPNVAPALPAKHDTSDLPLPGNAPALKATAIETAAKTGRGTEGTLRPAANTHASPPTAAKRSTGAPSPATGAPEGKPTVVAHADVAPRVVGPSPARPAEPTVRRPEPPPVRPADQDSHVVVASSAGPSSHCSRSQSGFSFEDRLVPHFDVRAGVGTSFSSPVVTHERAWCGNASVVMAATFDFQGPKTTIGSWPNQAGELAIPLSSPTDLTGRVVTAMVYVEAPPTIRFNIQVAAITPDNWTYGTPLGGQIPGRWIRVSQRFIDLNRTWEGKLVRVDQTRALVVSVLATSEGATGSREQRTWTGRVFVDEVQWQ